MSSILDYEFQLNFKNEGSFGVIDITEAVKFDGASFVVGQEDKRYGRDAYKVNEEIDLFFYKGAWDSINTPYQLPNGTVVYNLTMGFDYLIDVYKEFGFESEVEFIIKKGGVVFVVGVLDFQTSETDQITYLSCKIVQSTGKQTIKRRSDIVTDIFSTEDLDGNEVTPAVTENILLKAKPIRQISDWEYENTDVSIQNFGFQTFSGFPLFNNLTNFGIDKSFAPFSTDYTIQTSVETGALEQYREDIAIVKNDFNLTDIKIKIRNLSFISFADSNISVTKTLSVNYGNDYSDGNFNTIILEQTSDDVFSISNQDYDIEIPFLAASGFIFINYGMFDLFSSSYAPSFRLMNFSQTSGTLEITATSTAIDSVIKGVRYIDVIKKNVKRVNGSTVDANRFDVGGEYYDQYAFTGNLIKQRDDVPFPVKFKDLMENLFELNCDYQIIDNEVFIGQYADFYPNREIGVLLTAPDDSFKSTFNERYAINQFEFKYKTYEQDREEANTTDAIHTDSQWFPSNKQVENTKTIDVDLIRDAYKIESTRKLGLKETTSTSDDDKMFVIDVVPLAPSTQGGFTSVLSHNIDSDGNVQLLRTELFRWDLLGFGVGSIFTIEDGENVGEYTVIEITESLIRLEPIGFVPTFTGETFTEVSYFYSNVSLVNRTNEGLEFFENLIEGDNYSNLRYSIKRNIKTWHPYLATASKFNPSGTFRNTYFKDNGECITRFTGEPENIKENANIDNVDFGNALLTPYLYNTRLVAPFDSMINIIDGVDSIIDSTIGGFIRCIDNKGRVIKLYPKELDFLPSTESLTLTGEERFEGDILIITLSGSTITVNEVGYDVDVLDDAWYEFDGDYFKIYDINGLPIINPTKYDKIEVNGLTFDSSSDLLGYLINN